MPRLAEGAEEGVVVTWFVEPGAAVKDGDLLAELQVAKVSSEMHSPFSGRIVQLLVEPGGLARQGTPIAVIEEGEAAAAFDRPVPPTGMATEEKPPAPGGPAPASPS